MKTILALILTVVGWSCFAAPGQPYFAKNQSSLSLPPAAFWWVAADASTNSGAGVVTNWYDRIQQATWSNFGVASNCPKWNPDGIQFIASTNTWLTNLPGIYFGVTNNSHWIVMQRNPASGVFHDFLDYDNTGTLNWFWDDNNKCFAVFAGVERAQVGFTGTNFFDMAWTSDYVNNRIIAYSNGVPCITNSSSTIGGTWRVMGGSPVNGWFSGTIKELMVFTNHVLDSNEVYVLHKYGTNQYLLSP